MSHLLPPLLRVCWCKQQRARALGEGSQAPPSCTDPGCYSSLYSCREWEGAMTENYLVSLYPYLSNCVRDQRTPGDVTYLRSHRQQVGKLKFEPGIYLHSIFLHLFTVCRCRPELELRTGWNWGVRGALLTLPPLIVYRRAVTLSSLWDGESPGFPLCSCGWLVLIPKEALGAGPWQGQAQTRTDVQVTGQAGERGVQTELSMNPSLASARFPSSHYSS